MRMNFMIAAHTDAGIKKNMNQDALLVEVARTGLGRVCLCVICDGMGGLSNGELASATVIRTFERWFARDFPEMLAHGFDAEVLKSAWDRMANEDNRRISVHASGRGIRMGTTVVSLLIVGDDYYVMNVGDSRVYLLTDGIRLLTRDQTVAQRQVDMGLITPEAAQNHPQRNVLLQCVGASETVTPAYYVGKVPQDSVFVMCSDGFRHAITTAEIYEKFNPSALTGERVMRENAVLLTELNKQRLETDNISVALIRTCRGD